MEHMTSSAIYSRACELMPGGVNSAARAFGAVGGTPIVIDRGRGPYLWDVDGNKYIDYIGSWGPMIRGHAYEPIVDAIQTAVVKSTSFGAPTQGENQLAELIIEMVPSVEMVRLVNSGTEATMSAIRVARGFTGRDKIIKFAGNYHGHVDSLLVSAGSAAATLSVPDSPGVTSGATADTVVLAYNDVEGFSQVMREHGRDVAAVIVEPVVGNMGCVIPSSAFLRALREETERAGTVLIFDEVMTGFRLAAGGAQELFGVQPDMTTLGKIVGGGLPLGAFGGKREIMQHVLPAGKVFQAGTLSGNPLATAAGAAILKSLRDDPPYEKLERLSSRLADGLTNAYREAGLDLCLQRVGSMLTLFFTPGPVVDWATADHSDRDAFAKFFWSMMEQGVYLPCSPFEAWFVSAAHEDEDIDATITAAETALQSADG